jgi:hypothetical protein
MSTPGTIPTRSRLQRTSFVSRFALSDCEWTTGNGNLAPTIKKISVGAFMTTGRPTFNCPNCNALYQIVKVEAGPETVDRQVTCRACGGPLPGREGKFVIKYFLLRNAGRIQKWKRPRYRAERAPRGPT